jgi:ribonuclease HI
MGILGDSAFSYMEGLGCLSNNEVEIRAPLRGLKLAGDKGMSKPIINGDSKLIVEAMLNKKVNVEQESHWRSNFY